MAETLTGIAAFGKAQETLLDIESFFGEWEKVAQVERQKHYAKKKAEMPETFEPFSLSAEQAADYGIELDEGWNIEFAPGDNGEVLSTLISPDSWKIKSTGEYVSPEGEIYTQADMEQFSSQHTLLREAVIGVWYPSEYYEEPERFVDPDEQTEDIITLAQEDTYGFLKIMRSLGKNENTETLVEMLTGMTYDQSMEVYNQELKAEMSKDKSWAERFVRGEWLPDTLEDYWNAAGQGLLQLGATTGGLGEWVGKKVGWEGLEDISSKLTQYSLEGVQELGGEEIYGEPGTPSYYSKRAVAMIPTLIALIAPTVATGGGAAAVAAAAGAGRTTQIVSGVLGGGLTGTMLEGGMEAGSVYQETKDIGLADEVFFHNVELLSATNTLQFGAALLTRGSSSAFVRMLKYGGLAAGEVASEAGEEVAQEIFIRVALDDKVEWDQAMKDSAILGAIGGGIFAGAVNIYGRIQRKTIDSMTAEQKDAFDSNVQKGLREGFTQGKAESLALDKFAETPEGGALISRIAQEELDADMEVAEEKSADIKEAAREERVSSWRSALTEALEHITAIEEEWVSKNYLGPTKEQQARIDAVIADVASKYHVPEHTLRRYTVWEPIPGKPITRAALTEAEIDELIDEASTKPRRGEETALPVARGEATARAQIDLAALRKLAREKGYRITRLSKLVKGAPAAKFRITGITEDTKGNIVYAKNQEETRSFLETGSLAPSMPPEVTDVPPEPTSRDLEANIETEGKPKLTLAEANYAVRKFGEYILRPSGQTAWELTQQLRRETRAQRAESLKARSQELIIEEGMPPEAAMQQAMKETLAGEMPRVEAYLKQMTAQMRDALFSKVYHALKDEPFEMASTVTALTNALLGKAIPREPGVKGGSAYTRLRRVFGGEPGVFEALDKSSKEGKSLPTIIEGIYEIIGAPPIPVDRATADYLRSLSDVPYETPGLFEEPFYFPRVQDLNTPQGLKFAKRRLELDHALAAGEIEADRYKTDLSKAYNESFPKPLAAKFKDIFKPASPITGPEQAMVVRILKGMGMTLIDIGNLIRANVASVDMSFWRQAKILASGHPVAFWHANISAWQSLFSQKHAEASWEKISRHPRFELYERIRKETGADPLRIVQVQRGTSQWRAAEEFGYLTTERLIPRFTAKIPWVKWSGRAFAEGLNTIVWEVWNGQYEACLRDAQKIASGERVLKEGEAFDIYKEMAGLQKALAEMTQRASLGKAQALGPALSATFFAPRSKLGRLLAPRHLVSSNARVRKEAWRDFSLWIGITTGLLALGAWLDLWDVEEDPRSGEYGSLRIGNLRIDPWAGNRQFIVLYARLITGTGVSSVTGAEYEVNPIRALESFVRNSSAPLASILTDFWTGKNFLGEDVGIANKEQWLKRIAPFSIQDIWEAFGEGWKYAAIATIPAIFGEGIQTYTGDWVENWTKLGLPKYEENLGYGLGEPSYDTQDFWSDTASQFKGVSPSTLTEAKGYPAYIRAIAEAYNVIIPQLELLPNEKLISINANPEIGPTFREYHQMWLDRQKIVASGDEEALTDFDTDERTRNAYLGNFSQTIYALLVEYHAITDKKAQTDFLKEHPELAVDSRDEWLRSHPEENAKLAIWGQAKILTMEAYDEVQKLMKELGIPDKAMPEFTLPPKESIDNYFKYREQGEEFGWNSAEASLTLVEDDVLRKWLGREIIDTPVEALQISVKWRELDEQYDNPEGETKEERADYRERLLAANPEYAKDRRRRDAYDIGFPENLIEDYVEWYAVERTGWDDEWWLMEHKGFYRAAQEYLGWQERDFSKVPTREVAKLWEQYQLLPEGDARLEFRYRNPALEEWFVEQKGYTPLGDRWPPKTTGAAETEEEVVARRIFVSYPQPKFPKLPLTPHSPQTWRPAAKGIGGQTIQVPGTEGEPVTMPLPKDKKAKSGMFGFDLDDILKWIKANPEKYTRQLVGSGYTPEEAEEWWRWASEWRASGTMPEELYYHQYAEARAEARAEKGEGYSALERFLGQRLVPETAEKWEPKSPSGRGPQAPSPVVPPPSERAGLGYKEWMSRQPEELRKEYEFLESDRTDELEYNWITHNCIDFAEDLCEAAAEEGLEWGVAFIPKPLAGRLHHIVWFEKEGEIYYIEPRAEYGWIMTEEEMKALYDPSTIVRFPPKFSKIMKEIYKYLPPPF